MATINEKAPAEKAEASTFPKGKASKGKYSRAKPRIKRLLILLALWGLLPPKAATAILKWFGLRHA